MFLPRLQGQVCNYIPPQVVGSGCCHLPVMTSPPVPSVTRISPSLPPLTFPLPLPFPPLSPLPPHLLVFLRQDLFVALNLEVPTSASWVL